MVYLRGVGERLRQGLKRASAPVSACLLLVLLAVGCGYEIVAYSQALGDVRRVAIPGFRNDTYAPGVDGVISEALVREFQRRGAVELVDDPGAADLVISGSVTQFEARRRSFSSIQFALEYELRMGLELVVTRPDGTEVAIDRRALTESDFYFSSADLEVGRTNREEATRRLAGVLAGRIHDALYERISP